MTEFRPDTFFDGQWNGWGVTCDLAGKIRDRYVIAGEGEVYDARRHFRLTERYTFTDGRSDTLVWQIVTDDQGAFAGRDIANAVEGEGRQVGGDYVWRFQRRVPTALGEMTIHFTTRYHAVSATRVISTSRLTRWGLPIASMVAGYCRV